MSFSLIGTHVPVELEHPEVVGKTCPTFFDLWRLSGAAIDAGRLMVVAIDGPAGAGKSTVARALAARLGLTYLDSGAMYRCVALAALERRPIRRSSRGHYGSSSAIGCCSTAATSPS